MQSYFLKLLEAIVYAANRKDIIFMKLTFTNKKQHKNCLYFIRALHQIQRHNIKDNRKPVYLFASKEQLRLAPSMADLHRERTQDNCLIVFKSDVYSLIFDEAIDFKVMEIHSSKLLKSFTKNDGKVSLIELKTTNRGITVQYESDNSQVICFLNIQAEQIDAQWAQHPLSTRQHFFEVVNVCKLTQAEIKTIDMKDQQQIWLQFIQGGVCMRTSRGKMRKEGKVQFKQQSGYNYMTIKNKLHNRQFLNLKGDFFLDHLWRCYKKKRTIILYIKNICDRYQQNQIRQSYIIMQTKVQYGSIFKMIGCFISEQMGAEGEEAIRKEIHQRQRQMPKQSYLLKSEESNSQQVRNIVLNRFNQVDGQAIIAEQVFRQKKPLGKIQEGEQTFTRKFYSKY